MIESHLAALLFELHKCYCALAFQNDRQVFHCHVIHWFEIKYFTKLKEAFKTYA